MDCFYAAVEMRDNPELAHKPIAVGGPADKRGVLSTCNYKAREFGLHSAMATARAQQRCPSLIVVPVNMEKYREVSRAIRKIFHQYTDKVEPLSLDEAYLDVSDCQQHDNSATRIAKAIRQKIEDTQELTASAGIASNKFLAKIASDWHKPNGQFVITPKQIDAFMTTLAVEKLFGVGKVTAKKLHQLHIKTCGDLQNWEANTLEEHFGKFGRQLSQLAFGIDHRDVEPNRQRKSVSVENTYEQDLPDLAACLHKLPKLIEQLEKRAKPHLESIKSLFVKIKFDDFTLTTVEQTHSNIDPAIFHALMQNGWQRQEKPVRLLGLGVHLHNEDSVPQQQNLF